MGFGFNLGMIFIILPLSLILLFLWIVTKKSIFGKILAGIWGLIVLLVLFVSLFGGSQIIQLKKKDYHGEYIIDKRFYSGKQSDWQYDHYRFHITKNDSIFFQVTDGEKIIKTYKGKVKTTSHNSARLVIKMEDDPHHILDSNPTTYRQKRNFYLVFYSPKYKNVFFRKGKWKKHRKSID